MADAVLAPDDETPQVAGGIPQQPAGGARAREATAPSHFQRATAVEPDTTSPGRYRAAISDQWNAPIIPHGGVVTSIGIRAMQDALGREDQLLRSVTVVFAAQVTPGPLAVDVATLRTGRTMSQLTATVRNEGSDAGHTALAVFGCTRPGFEFTELVAPTAPPPSECPSWRDPPPDASEFERRFNPTFWKQAEGRTVMGHAPWHDWEPETSERVYWYRFDETPRMPDGTVDPCALVTFCDTMPGAVGERMGPDTPLYLAPSADLTVHILGQTSADWVLVRNRARHASDGYGSLEIELWDPAGHIVAYGTQMMFFSFPDGPPPPEKVRPPIVGDVS